MGITQLEPEADVDEAVAGEVEVERGDEDEAIEPDLPRFRRVDAELIGKVFDCQR